MFRSVRGKQRIQKVNNKPTIIKGDKPDPHLDVTENRPQEIKYNELGLGDKGVSGELKPELPKRETKQPENRDMSTYDDFFKEVDVKS